MPQNQSLVFNNVMSRGNTNDHGDTTSITLNSLAKRDAEPCAAGKPCADKRYAFSIMLLARTTANNYVVGMNNIPCFFPPRTCLSCNALFEVIVDYVYYCLRTIFKLCLRMLIEFSCSKGGKCGYGPDYCSDNNCVSNCNATAMCGRYSDDGSLKCGMNLCCSYYGKHVLQFTLIYIL